MHSKMFGKELSKKQSMECLQEVAELLNCKDRISEFIGSHPVPLTYEIINHLLNEDYNIIL